MNIRTTAPALIAPIAAVALLLPGCGSSSKTSATSTALAPTATMVASGRPPVAGSTRTSAANRATMATGEHDHAGDFCTGRDQPRYAGEGLVCVTGRLKPTK
jgi:hypothetical protein